MTEAKCVLASLTGYSLRVINLLTIGYDLPGVLPWAELANALTNAEDALARLDERLRSSPIREGWIARTHFQDAAASLWLDGELVPLEDLVLHDARMDVRTPTHALTRANAVLRARRRIASAEPGWALSPSGLDGLLGRRGSSVVDPKEGRAAGKASDDNFDVREDDRDPDISDDPWDAHMKEIDALVARSKLALTVEPAHRAERHPLVYDLDWDEEAKIAEWRAVVDQTRKLPPVLAAALVARSWNDIAPVQHVPWLGQLLASALLRARGKTRAHLLCLNIGLRVVPRETRRAPGRTAKLRVLLDATTAAAESGLKDHDRWLLTRQQLKRKLVGRRSTSKLPALIDLVLATPIASAGMVAQALRVTPRAAQDLVAELGLREVTGRGRYRAWGIV